MVTSAACPAVSCRQTAAVGDVAAAVWAKWDEWQATRHHWLPIAEQAALVFDKSLV